MKDQGKKMGVETSRNHLLEKSKTKASHKKQGKSAPDKHELSGGDAFAYGLSSAMKEAESMKGSKQGFLGVATESLNPIDYCCPEKLHVTKK